ncbi:MAG: hypothetical protein Q9163_004808 [Psora crenata]
MRAFLSHHASHRPSTRDLRAQQYIFIALGLITLFVFSWSNLPPGSVPHLPFYSTTILDPISNSTLGFQKVFGLALPERQDRIRPLVEAANATDVSLTLLNAVRDAEIAPDSRPQGWTEENHRAGELGCLVSHLRTWNKMITHNINSALILESDADWDLRLKKIMHALPPAIDAIVDFPFVPPDPSLISITTTALTASASSSPSSTDPYSSNTWDIIWLGHCGSNHQGWSRIYSWRDSSVPPAELEFTFDLGLEPDQRPRGTRSLFLFARTTCSTAYAISLRGARKLAASFTADVNENLDIQLSHLCTTTTDLVCLGVWPQVFTAAATLSNIDHTGEGDQADGTLGDGDDDDAARPGPALQFSARVNAKGVLDHGTDPQQWKAEWDTMWTAGTNGTWEEVELNRTEAFR